MKITLAIISCVLLITSFSHAQNDSNKNADAFERGQQIINQARKAIDKDNVLQNLKSFFITFDETIPGGLPYMGTDISIVMPDKVKIITDYNGKTKFIKTVSEGKYSEDSEMILNGEVYSMQSIGAPSSKSAMSEKEGKAYIRSILSDKLLPLLLFNPLNSEIKFEYVGKAEVSGQVADMVKAKSPFTSVGTTLFFDGKTHLLIMKIDENDTDEQHWIKRKFFSDYKPADGVLIPRVIQGDYEITDKKTSERKTGTSTPVFVKEVKINRN